MNSQTLRTGMAAILVFSCIIVVTILSLTGTNVPQLIELVTVASTGYLFGVTTNGSTYGKSNGTTTKDTPTQ